MPAPRTVLLDADVLIDYRKSELGVLKLVTRHVGRLAVIPSTLEEVRGVTTTECAQLGIEVVEVKTGQMLRATKVEPSVSFNDHLCLVVCREAGGMCATNDGALRRLCRRHGVETPYGLSLMVELGHRRRTDAAAGHVSRLSDAGIEPLPHQRPSADPLCGCNRSGSVTALGRNAGSREGERAERTEAFFGRPAKNRSGAFRHGRHAEPHAQLTENAV